MGGLGFSLLVRQHPSRSTQFHTCRGSEPSSRFRELAAAELIEYPPSPRFRLMGDRTPPQGRGIVRADNRFTGNGGSAPFAGGSQRCCQTCRILHPSATAMRSRIPDEKPWMFGLWTERLNRAKPAGNSYLNSLRFVVRPQHGTSIVRLRNFPAEDLSIASPHQSKSISEPQSGQ